MMMTSIVVGIDGYPLLVETIPTIPVVTTPVGVLAVVVYAPRCPIHYSPFHVFAGRTNVQRHRLQRRGLHLEATGKVGDELKPGEILGKSRPCHASAFSALMIIICISGR
jgi:hypothetical protein